MRSRWPVFLNMQPINAAHVQAVQLFTGLPMEEFSELVVNLERDLRDDVADGLPGRQWSLSLADRILLVAIYYRTDASVRQLGTLFGVTRSAAGRVLARLGPRLALQPLPQRRHQTENVLITNDGLAFVTDEAPERTERDGVPRVTRLSVEVGSRLVLRAPLS